MPCSPMRVSRPYGSSCTKWAWATSIACSTSASVASGRPSVRFSRTDIENSVGSSNAVATALRSEGSVRSRMSTPSSRMRPSVTSYRRGTSAVSSDLPDPVAPTSATVSPGCRSRSTPRSVHSSGRASGKRNPTFSRRRWPRGAASSRSPSSMVRSSSKTCTMRSAAVIDSWVIDSRKPSEEIGQTSESIIVMKATRVPSVTRP